MDIFNVLADVRREKIFDYVCLHPQLCVGDGEEFLKVLLAGKDADRLYIAACDPRMQEKMFRGAFDAAGFDRSRLVSLDIRNKTTEEAVEGVQSFLGKRAPKWKERWWMTPLAISGAIAWKHQDKEELPMAIRAKSYRYTISVRWTGEKKGALAAAGKPPVEVATPPEFKGHEGVWSPEDLFVAAVNACIMTTFLAYAARAGLSFEEYESEAEGLLEFLDGRFVFTKIFVRPRIALRPGEETAKAEEILHKAERDCLVSNSIRTEVVLEPTVV